MKYRVVLKVSYNEAWFDFDSAEEACKLAELLLTSMVDSDDQKRKAVIRMDIINTAVESDEDED